MLHTVPHILADFMQCMSHKTWTDLVQAKCNSNMLLTDVQEICKQSMLLRMTWVWQTFQQWKCAVCQFHHYTLHNVYHRFDVKQHQTDWLSTQPINHTSTINPFFFLSLWGGTWPFACQCWGLPHRLAQCATRTAPRGQATIYLNTPTKHDMNSCNVTPPTAKSWLSVVRCVCENRVYTL